MRAKLILLGATIASISACSHSGTAGDPASQGDFARLNGAKVEVSREGGYAALSINHLVRHDDRAYVYVQRRICGTSCAAPMDSASGTLLASTTDSLFKIVLAQDPFSLKDDYGVTRGAADMMMYVVRVTAGGSVKTIRADDGTMPPPLRRIVQSVSEVAAAARR